MYHSNWNVLDAVNSLTVPKVVSLYADKAKIDLFLFVCLVLLFSREINSLFPNAHT